MRLNEQLIMNKKQPTETSLNQTSNSRCLISERRGITLISLIITIVILLILAGLSIELVMNGNIFEEASGAQDTVNDKVKQQQEQVDNIEKKHEEFNIPSEEEELLTKINCYKCNGLGTITKECSPTILACEKCGGSAICPGRLPSHSTSTNNGEPCEFCGQFFYCEDSNCPECGLEYVTCFDCADRGVQCKGECRYCQGSGEIITPCAHKKYETHTYLETCAECDGTGKEIIY